MNMEMQSKKCTKCGIVKPFSEFQGHTGHRDGRRSQCKHCVNKDYREYYSRTREKRAKTAAVYRELHREEIRQRDRMIFKQRRNAILRRNKKYYEDHPEIRKAHSAVRDAKLSGRLVPPEQCTQCGTVGPVQAHHHDYSKPLDVEWLCVPCHRKRHVGIELSDQKAA
jgi:hypothetical protein